MEVFLLRGSQTINLFSLLHVRGGVSSASPVRGGIRLVFSTSVEVFPCSRPITTRRTSLLHVRGGVSQFAPIPGLLDESSPRPWRCFLDEAKLYLRVDVFSTSVEVFLMTEYVNHNDESLLHVRGGVSIQAALVGILRQSSPRPWRCFWSATSSDHLAAVFSTSVEVFPRKLGLTVAVVRLLHVRGGVSILDTDKVSLSRSSPRPWRCFIISPVFTRVFQVFSTSVEVFPMTLLSQNTVSRLLHVRGGVSHSFQMSEMQRRSSPRPWRCFWHWRSCRYSFWAFSTSVEVFLELSQLESHN